MKQKARNKLLQFDRKTQLLICERDVTCLFCRLQYHMPNIPGNFSLQMTIADIMHFVNKSAGGLGIPQNGVLGCRYHHGLLDNGNKGLREEMLQMMEEYLKSIYPEWNKEKLVVNKYKFLED